MKPGAGQERANSDGGWGGARIGWPVPHLLAMAPLDVWVRMLARSRGSGGVSARYWPRLAFALFTSFVGTVCTVHERVLWALYSLHPHGRALLAQHRPDVIVILGYYRSGTTHLHNLMSCDRRFITPRWRQCLAGQGHWLGWNIMRVLLVPFLGSTRPQDGVGFGPNWPGEDDFALATWGGCSSLPGRHVFPGAWDHWRRWHDLEELSEDERDRWRRLTRRFVFKLTGGKASRVVLLKTPSHTARVAELDRLFNGRARFVHLVREPGAVIDSNVRMFHALRDHALQDLPPAQTIRERVGVEYEQTERRCAAALDAIDPSRWVRLRFKDLRADPMGSLGTIYDALGMGLDETTRRSVRDYLGSLGSYRAQREPIDLGEPADQERAACEAMRERYALNAPAHAGSPLEYTPRPEPARIRAALAALGAAMMCWGAWVLMVGGLHAMSPALKPRLVPLVWLCGAAIGLGAHRASGGRGGRALGIWCALLTVLVAAGALFPVSVINWNWASGDGTRAWLYHNAKSAYEGLASVSGIVLLTLGAMTAYRHGASDGPRPPGV